MAGIIRYFLFHRTAVNLLMMLVMIAGVVSYLNINTQLWPTWETRKISVSITWPGASSDAVDRLVAKPLDQKINALNNVDTFNTYVSPGSVYASINYEEHTDMDVALSEVQNKVASISTFPSDIENPVISLAQPLEHVTRVLVFGDFSNRVATQLSETFVDMLEAEGIKNVRVQGLKQSQVYVDLDPILSRQYNLTPAAVAGQVRSAIREGSGGFYEQDNASFSTKVKRVGDLNSMGDITLEAGAQTLLLRDLATISQEYPESSYGSVFPQGNGFFLQVLRNVDEDAIDITTKIESVVDLPCFSGEAFTL